MPVIRIPSPNYRFIEKRGDASYVNDTPPFIARGGCYIAQVKTVQITVVNSYAYQLTINGTTLTYTSSGAATVDEIVRGLVGAVNASSITRALVFAWFGSNNELRLEDLDPRQATTSSAGTNLLMTTGRTQATYDYMSSAPGSGTYPAAGVEFWWDIYEAINSYWNLTMGWPANYLPRARYRFAGLVAGNGSGALYLAGTSGLAVQDATSNTYDGMVQMPTAAAVTDYIPFTTITNSLGMIRAFKGGGATNQQFRWRSGGIYQLPYWT